MNVYDPKKALEEVMRKAKRDEHGRYLVDPCDLVPLAMVGLFGPPPEDGGQDDKADSQTD